MDSAVEKRFLNQEHAQAVDARLMSQQHGWQLEQLMELAGLSVADAIEHAVGVGDDGEKGLTLCALCGPGNNGGDGLVVAKHLAQRARWGKVKIWYPKRPKANADLFNGLVKSCQAAGVEFYDERDDQAVMNEMDEYDVVVDAMFGFSFKGEPRAPYTTVVKALASKSKESQIFVACVDIPSGDNVDDGPPENGFSIQPDVLISLTAPKKWAFNRMRRTCDGNEFKRKPCKHYVGGRFLSKKLVLEFENEIGVDLGYWNEMYSGRDQFVYVGLI